MTCYECNLQSNRIGKISKKNLYDYKLALDEATQEFKVTDKDGFPWGRGKTVKGAMISAMNQGIRLKKIDITDFYVPIKECIEAVKQ